jgi:hypothetical protein
LNLLARRRNKQLRALESRLTKALAAIAGIAGAAVFAGEAVRRYRRRLEQRHPDEGGPPRPESPVEALQVAGRASQDTLLVAVAGYNAASRRETAMFNLFFGFVTASLISRVSTLGIREGWWPFGDVRVGGRHIHHFIPGILLSFVTGSAAIVTESRSLETALAVPFGAGIGLTVDEAALLLDLEDVYWRPEGVVSVQLSFGVASFLAAVVLGMRMLQRGESRVAQQGLIPG